MDGEGRDNHNAFNECWIRTLKRKYIYLYLPENGLSLYQGKENVD
jgi:hypothetical protein